MPVPICLYVIAFKKEEVERFCNVITVAAGDTGKSVMQRRLYKKVEAESKAYFFRWHLP